MSPDNPLDESPALSPEEPHPEIPQPEAPAELTMPTLAARIWAWIGLGVGAILGVIGLLVTLFMVVGLTSDTFEPEELETGLDWLFLGGLLPCGLGILFIVLSVQVFLKEKAAEEQARPSPKSLAEKFD